jgi:predicted metal-dependent hydrolase
MSLRALLYRRSSEPTSITVTCDRAEFSVRVRRHRQARRYTLRIHAVTREVMLTMPPRGSLKDAQVFAQKHSAWIAARLARLPQATAFAEGGIVPLRGVEHRIEHRRGARGVVWTEVARDGERLLCVAGQSPNINRRVIDFLKREALHDLERLSHAYAAQLGVKIRRITMRDQASRWGSCSSTGMLSYSWRLILAPPFVLDYLAAHEVSHLVELNHSPKFWRVLSGICPDMERAKTWLNAHGASLHRYGLTGR